MKRLEHEPAFDPIEALKAYARNRYTAINRAAHRLARKRLADVHRIWCMNRKDRRRPCLWLFRPGVTPADVRLEPAVTQYERRPDST